MSIPETIKLSNFQSFDSTGATISGARRFNIFVGPNNVGKSKLLQAVQRLSRKGDEPYLIDASGEDYEIRFSLPISKEIASRVFNAGTHGGAFGSNWGMVGAHLVDSSVTMLLRKNSALTVDSVTLNTQNAYVVQKRDDILTELQGHAGRFQLPFVASERFFLAAERDVRPEAASGSDVIEPSGSGVTNAIQRVINSSAKDRSAVTVSMLHDLNEILHPQFRFKEILTRYHDAPKEWEIYFQTEDGRLVRLSQSGSGLKTILCLLANVHLKLGAKAKPVTQGVFVFEELENSLHPRVQRNLYQYLRRKFTGESIVLISTHSSVAIDFFQHDKEAAFFQVNQSRGKSECRRIEAFEDRVGTLDALGIRASDALMSNFVVWVEGPSDRTYINGFISAASDNQLQEGREYSVMFYGGRLLSHLTMSEDEEANEFIRLLKLNPKCAVVIDSDKANAPAPLNATKRRIIDEANASSRMSWLTKGREIENYVSAEFWVSHFGVSNEAVGRYSDVFQALKGQKSLKSGRTFNSKTELAAYVDKFAREHDYVLDWREKADELVRHIRSANS